MIAWPFAAVAVIFGLFAWWLYDVDGAERSLLRGMVASVFVAITVYARNLSVAAGAVSERADRRRIRARRLPRSACWPSTVSYQEPSLVFLLGTDTRFTDGAGAAEFLRSGPCHFALIDPRSERSFVQRAESIGLLYSRVQRIEGFNISIGKPVTLTVYRSEANP